MVVLSSLSQNMKTKHFSIKGAEESHKHTKLDKEKNKIHDKRKHRVKHGRGSDGVSTGTENKSNRIQVHSLVRKLSSPGCNIVDELNKIRSQYPTFFGDGGRVITSILSQLGRNIDAHNNRTKYTAYKFWDWVTKEAKVKLNNFHFNSFLNICAKCHDWKRAIEVLNVEMKNDGVAKDEFSYTCAINSCVYNCDKAIELFNQMRAERIKPRNEILYNALISTCSTGFNIKGAIDTYSKMKEDGINPNVKTYSALITCCEKCRKWELALKYLNEMKDKGLTNCPYSYSAAIGACGNCGQWGKALELFRELATDKATEVIYAVTIEALQKCLQWEKALDLFEEAKSKIDRVTVVSYGSAISACAKGFQYLQCLGYLDELTTNQIPKNCIIYGAAISCMEKCFRCDIIFKLFHQMKIDNINPTSYIYKTIMTACAKCQLWKQGLDVFIEMNALGLEKDLVAYNTVLDLTCPYDMEKAREIFQQGVQHGLYARLFKSDDNNSYFEIDLHFLSVGAAITAILCWFDEFVIPHFTTTDPNSKTIHIITGYGKSRMENIVKKENTYAKQGIAKHVRKVLELLNLKEIPQHNIGMVKLCTETFQKELVENNRKIILNTEAYMEYVVDDLNIVAADIQNIKQVQRGLVQQEKIISDETANANTKNSCSKKEQKEPNNTRASVIKVASNDKKKSKKEKRKEKDSSTIDEKHRDEKIIKAHNKVCTISLKEGIEKEKKKKKRKTEVSKNLESKFDSLIDEENDVLDVKPKKKRKSEKKKDKRKK